MQRECNAGLTGGLSAGVNTVDYRRIKLSVIFLTGVRRDSHERVAWMVWVRQAGQQGHPGSEPAPLRLATVSLRGGLFLQR